jgi:hypothetical protein
MTPEKSPQPKAYRYVWYIAAHEAVSYETREEGTRLHNRAHDAIGVYQREEDGTLTHLEDQSMRPVPHEGAWLDMRDAIGLGSFAINLREAAMHIDISDISWEDISLEEDLPKSRLQATLHLNGVNHHFDAIEVQDGQSSVGQAATCFSGDEVLQKYSAVDPDAGPFNTVAIDGRAYALFMTPFRQ